MRDKYAGTYLIDGDKIEKLNTKTEQTISPWFILLASLREIRGILGKPNEPELSFQ